MSETPERDALDHIMRVAREGIQPTRRLDWIALRAQYALEGKQWSRDIREQPRNSVLKMQKENHALREELGRARAAVKQASGYTLEEFEQMRREVKEGR